MKTNIITLILLPCIFLTSCKSFSQKKLNETILNDEEYRVINNLFTNESTNVKLYYLTDFSKTWSYLMSSTQLDNLLGPPCNNGEKVIKWEDIFSESDFKKIKDEIITSKPVYLNSDKLDSSFILVDNLLNSDETYNAVSIISKPIIIRDLAIVKRSSLNGDVIIIAKKNIDKWEVICRKSVFETSYD